jgi:hypothetical protein
MKVEFDIFANLDVDGDLIQFELDTSLPVQREMESWRSPLASILPFRRRSLDHTA